MKNEITKDVLLKAGFKKNGRESNKSWNNGASYNHVELVYRNGKFTDNGNTYYKDDISIHLNNEVSADGTEDKRVLVKIQNWLHFTCETDMVDDIVSLSKLLSLAGYKDLAFDVIKQAKA